VKETENGKNEKKTRKEGGKEISERNIKKGMKGSGLFFSPLQTATVRRSKTCEPVH
jgi:hypothetical protein